MKQEVKDYLMYSIGMGFFTALFIEISWRGILAGCVFWMLMCTPMLMKHE
jgi:hypothetical protein